MLGLLLTVACTAQLAVEDDSVQDSSTQDSQGSRPDPMSVIVDCEGDESYYAVMNVTFAAGTVLPPLTMWSHQSIVARNWAAANGYDSDTEWTATTAIAINDDREVRVYCGFNEAAEAFNVDRYILTWQP